MQRKIGFIILAIVATWIFATLAAAQEPTGQFAGRVLLRGERQPIVGATVTLLDLELVETTDETGRFRFENVAAGDYELSIQAPEIITWEGTVTVVAGQTAKRTFYVDEAGFVMDEVVVTDRANAAEPSRQKITREELAGVPGANNDPIRIVENLPGVATTSIAGFGNDGLAIRGTSSEDSLYVFDGFGIPQLFHFGGFVSIVNAELVQDVIYNPGAYSLSYGTALGGVVEVVGRPPRTDRFGGVIDLSNYASYALVEGPLGGPVAGAATVRRSFIDFILPAVIPEDSVDFTVAPRFYDYTVLLAASLPGSHTLRLTALGSDDGVALVGEADPSDPLSGDSFDFGVSWHRVDAHWLWVPTDTLSNDLAVDYFHGLVRAEFGPDLGQTLVFDVPSVRDDLIWTPTANLDVRGGFSADYTVADINATVVRGSKEGQPGGPSLAADDFYDFQYTTSTWNAGAYLETDYRPVDWFALVDGYRFDYLDYIDASAHNGRLKTRFFPTDRATVFLAEGVYHQWPGTDEYAEEYGNPDLDPEVAYSSAGGGAYDFGAGYTIDVQGYYKWLDDLVSPTTDGDPLPYRNTGVGLVYGAELLARKNLTDRLFGWISYTYSVARRKDRAGTDWRYFDEDQRHNFIVLAGYHLGENHQWRLGAKWQYFTGLPYTAIDGAIYNADSDSYLPSYSDQVNDRRRGDYHKLDLRVDKKWVFNRWVLNTYLDLQNVYFKEYPIGYRYNYDYSESRAVSFPAFWPSIGVQARF